MQNETKTAVIAHGAVSAMMWKPSQKVKLIVSELLSYSVPSAPGSTEPQRKTFFDFRKATFPTGFVRRVKRGLEKAGYNVIVKSKDIPEPRGPARPKVDNFPDNPEYEYQYDTAERLVVSKRFIAQLATGAGKSRTFKICEQRLGMTTLFLTTRKTLMYQMADNYKATITKDIGIIGDGAYQPHPTKTTFAISDTLVSRLKKRDWQSIYEKLRYDWLLRREVMIDVAAEKAGLPKSLTSMRNPPGAVKEKLKAIRSKVEARYPIPEQELKDAAKKRAEQHARLRQETIDYLAKVQFVCLEEAHEISDSGFYEILQFCKNAHYRLALTATPFMKDNEEANMRLMAAVGPIGIVVTVKQLIDSGILATPKIKFASYAKPDKLSRGSAWQRAYTVGIVENEERNKICVREALRAKQYGLTTMALVMRTKHGNDLKKMAMRYGLRVHFISGEHSQATRKKYLDMLANGELDMLIGSTILDVGVDVPSVGLVCLMGGYKAEVELRQRLGRGMRGKKHGPNIVFVLDFKDEHNKHLAGHYLTRRSYIEETPGLAEGIVEEFDYTSLGFRKIAA